MPKYVMLMQPALVASRLRSALLRSVDLGVVRS